MRKTSFGLALALACWSGAVAWGQPPREEERRDRGGDERRDRGGDDRRGGFESRGGFDPRGGGGEDRRGGEERRGGFDPRQWIEGMDANHNGIIEPSELSERSARFLGRAAEQAGLKAGEPWPVDKLIAATSRGGESSRDSSNRPAEAPRTESAPAKAAAKSQFSVLGFGEKDGGIKIPGFDAPLPTGKSGAVTAKQYDEKTIARVEEMLREADTNKNGYLDPDEIKAYRNWSTPPEESDLDKDGRLSRAELLERIAKRNASRSGSTSSSSPGGSSTPAVDQGAQARKYAEGIIQKYDANKSGYLEKDEWKEMKPEYQAADVNKDNVISLDELVARLNALNSGQGGGASGSGGPGSGGPGGSGRGGPGGSAGAGGLGGYGSRDRGERDKSGKPLEKKPPVVRVLTPTERLPKGLPDWFLRNDADADGQVSMSEYAAAWTDSTAAEFAKYDTNSDGIITANECLAVDKDKKR